MKISKGKLALLFKVLHTNNLMTIASVNNNKPSAAIVEFIAEDDLSLVFATSRKFRKYKNLIDNPAVAITVGTYGDATIQYEGVAIELSVAAERPYADKLALHMQHNYYPVPPRDNYAFFRVAPKWIRYVDVEENPWDEFELRFV